MPLTPKEIHHELGNLPYMSLARGEVITEFINEHKPKSILELGFFKGVSTCYMANAAMNYGGFVTTIDLVKALDFEPNIHATLKRCGCTDAVAVVTEKRSFTMAFLRMLDDCGPKGIFDLVYLDGGHTWDVTGFAFFLVDLVLKPGGFMIFDDLTWTMNASLTPGTDGLYKHYPEDERAMAQVGKVFELLVQTHPSYRSNWADRGWGYAQKAK